MRPEKALARHYHVQYMKRLGPNIERSRGITSGSAFRDGDDNLFYGPATRRARVAYLDAS